MNPPRIVVLDGYTLSPLAPGETSPDHPSWDALAAIGDLAIYDRTAPDELLERAKGAAILLTNKTPITAAQIAALPDLRTIGVMATGTNVVDLPAATDRGICVTNVPGYSTSAVAQHVFALLLELTTQTGATDRAVREGRWTAAPDFCFTLGPIRELAGKTLGIAGFGAIGQAVARIGAAFGMQLLIHSRTRRESDLSIAWADDWADLFRRSDVLSLHCPLTPETNAIVRSEHLALMKPTALLINTGRGGLIHEADLAAALRDGVIAGYGADVLSAEPPPADNPLLTAPRTVLTPHLGWASVEARHTLMDAVVANLRAFLEGKPQNVVNPSR